MRLAYRVLGLTGLSLLTGCVTAQQQTVVLSKHRSAFEAPADGRWRKAHESRPVAILAGRAESTRTLLPVRAALEASCYGGKPRLRLALSVGLRTGPINVAYRFDDKAQQNGNVRVRGQSRNIVVIDHPVAATAMLNELRASSALTVRLARTILDDHHSAHFRWTPDDPLLAGVAAACQGAGADTGRAKPPAPDDEDDDTIDDAIRDALAGT